jgi:hypothetical protein
MPGKEFQGRLLEIVSRYQLDLADLNEINRLVTDNAKDIKILEMNYNNLMLAFEAQKEELRKSREVFENKKREWENYKLKLSKVTHSKSEKKNKENDEKFNQWKRGSRTPPGFWNVDFIS